VQAGTSAQYEPAKSELDRTIPMAMKKILLLFLLLLLFEFK
jgi:hypothetical protein